jgi:hypothetical protein
MVGSLNMFSHLRRWIIEQSKNHPPSPCYSIVFLPVQLVSDRLVGDAVQFDFAGIFTKAHESATGILQHEQTPEGKANRRHETGHVEPGGTADEETVAPTTNGGTGPLTIIGKTERTQTIVHRYFPVGDRILADKLVIGNVRDHTCFLLVLSFLLLLETNQPTAVDYSTF